jgi:hypothetical protein
LDHAWFETINKFVPAAINKFTKFPVYRSLDALEAALRGKNVDSASPDLFKFLTTQIKPFMTGNDVLWSIHKMDILDKHELLLPTIQYASIGDIELVHDGGRIQQGGTLGTWQTPPYYIPIQSGWRVKKKGRVSATLLFGRGVPWEHMDVAEMLALCSFEVANTVSRIEIFYVEAVQP